MSKKRLSYYDNNKEIPIKLTLDDPFYGFKLDGEQLIFVNAMLNPNNKIVFVNAKSGVGKTFLSVATANILVKGGRYDGAFFIASPVQEMKQGYLPGTYEEKSMLYYEPLFQALSTIGENPLLAMDEKINYWIKPMTHTFTRGTNLQRSVVLISEAQNFYGDELKKVLTRCDDECLVIVEGHTGQCDIIVHPERSGFARYIEWFRNEPYAQVCTLTKNYRGVVSQHADELEF